MISETTSRRAGKRQGISDHRESPRGIDIGTTHSQLCGASIRQLGLVEEKNLRTLPTYLRGGVAADVDEPARSELEELPEEQVIAALPVGCSPRQARHDIRKQNSSKSCKYEHNSTRSSTRVGRVTASTVASHRQNFAKRGVYRRVNVHTDVREQWMNVFHARIIAQLKSCIKVNALERAKGGRVKGWTHATEQPNDRPASRSNIAKTGNGMVNLGKLGTLSAEMGWPTRQEGA